MAILPAYGCTPAVGGEGALAGRVTVGPLMPVVGPDMVEPTPGPEVFADRKLVIFEADGEQPLFIVDLQPDGSYHVDLPVGAYRVDINYLGIDHAPGLPVVIEIHAGEVTLLDIEIDTGIR